MKFMYLAALALVALCLSACAGAPVKPRPGPSSCIPRTLAQTCYEEGAGVLKCEKMYAEVKARMLVELKNEQDGAVMANTFADICAVGCVARKEGINFDRVDDALEPICRQIARAMPEYE